jgi:hypothetical protein
MPRASTLLLPRKARLQLLAEQLTSLEVQLGAARRIPVFRVARCGHGECGSAPPAQLPADALLIEMGCRHEIPDVHLPDGQASYRSRSEHQQHLPTAGAGLGSAGVLATLERLNTITPGGSGRVIRRA